MKFLKIFFELLSKRSVRIILAIVIFLTLIVIGAKKTYIDPQKLDQTIDVLSKKDKKNFEFIVSENKKKEVMEQPKRAKINPTINIKKKEIVLDKYETEENIKNTTNLFVALSKLDDIYNERLKNKKIDYKRQIKDGDYIYIVFETKDFLNEKFGKNDYNYLNFRIFLPVTKDDDIYYKYIVNKKVGDKIVVPLSGVLDTIPEKNLEELKSGLTVKLKQLDKSYNSIDDILKDSKQYFTILDFIPKNVVKELNLRQFE